MRSVFGFKTRSADRDRQTDTMRFQRIRDLIAEVSGEMDREKTGFEKRYGTVAADAAFLVEAMDNEAAPAGDSERIASLTETLRSCERRIAFLNRQMVFMEECRQFVQQFVDANGIDAEGPAKAE